MRQYLIDQVVYVQTHFPIADSKLINANWMNTQSTWQIGIILFNLILARMEKNVKHVEKSL